MSDARSMAAWGEQLRQIVAGPGMREFGLDPLELQVFERAGSEALGLLQSVTPLCSRAFLTELFSECGGLTLPDVCNGYFIDTPERLRRRLEQKDPLEPRSLESDKNAEVLCFGSDGGGGRFAFVCGAEYGVWCLPVGGVFDGVFRDLQTPLRKIGVDAAEFGQRLVADVTAFLRGDSSWKYIGK
jgi:hypothetical protein